MYVADSPDGPFAAAGHYPGVNPAPIYHDGAFYMTNQFTEVIYTTPSLATSSHWTVYANISHAELPPAADEYRVEDPYLWVDKRGNWHLINHGERGTRALYAGGGGPIKLL